MPLFECTCAIIRSCLVSSMTQMQLFGALNTEQWTLPSVPIVCQWWLSWKWMHCFLPHDELDNNTTNTDTQHCIIISRLAALEVFCLPFNWNEDYYGIMVYFIHVMWLQRTWLIAVIVSFDVVNFCCKKKIVACECEWHIVWHSKPRIIIEAIWKTVKWAASHRNNVLIFDFHFVFGFRKNEYILLLSHSDDEMIFM